RRAVQGVGRRAVAVGDHQWDGKRSRTPGPREAGDVDARVDVALAVRVARRQLVPGDEEDARPVVAGAEEVGVARGGSGGRQRNEGGRVSAALVDVDERVRVLGYERFLGIEEDPRSVVGRAVEEGVGRAVAAGRSEADLRRGAGRALVDVEGRVEIGRGELLEGPDPDAAAVLGRAFEV